MVNANNRNSKEYNISDTDDLIIAIGLIIDYLGRVLV